MAKADRRNVRNVIIRREEVVEGGHHGGAWKVAYADFVTAMMAFFLLMWLLNMTSEEQRKGLADYFSPNNVLSRGSSGTGEPFGGHTPFDAGALASDRGAVELKPGPMPALIAENEEDEPAPPSRAEAKPPKQVSDLKPESVNKDYPKSGSWELAQPGRIGG